MARAKVKRKLSPYNRHVQREMKAGRSMKQAAASWKSGGRGSARRGVARLQKRKKRKAAARKPRSTGGRKKMAGFNTQKIMKYIRLAALGAPAARVAMLQTSGPDKIRRGLEAYTGFNIETGQFNAAKLAEGWGPYVAAVATTYGIPKLAGIIRGL